MPIEKNQVVHFHYVLSELNGHRIESSYDDESAETGQPMACLIGHQNILSALEDEIVKKELGDRFEVSIPSEQAYGPRLTDSVQRVSKKHLMITKKQRLIPGAAVKINTDKGPRDVRVVKVGKFNVDVDTNHPLAGKHLQFLIKIVAVRDASAEELSHGHVHGDGGHHH